MNIIDKKYEIVRSRPGDIFEHIPTLKKYSQECDVIVEMGVGKIISTWSFLAARPKKLTSYDINHPSIHGSDVEEVYNACREVGIEFNFILADTSKIEIDNCDLLFIDTLHTYDHLCKELKLHANKARKYIIFHDTVTFGERGEIQGSKGLMPAILEFLEINKNWQIKEHHTNNNGLLVLNRIN